MQFTYRVAPTTFGRGKKKWEGNTAESRKTKYVKEEHIDWLIILSVVICLCSIGPVYAWYVRKKKRAE